MPDIQPLPDELQDFRPEPTEGQRLSKLAVHTQSAVLDPASESPWEIIKSKAAKRQKQEQSVTVKKNENRQAAALALIEGAMGQLSEALASPEALATTLPGVIDDLQTAHDLAYASGEMPPEEPPMDEEAMASPEDEDYAMSKDEHAKIKAAQAKAEKRLKALEDAQDAATGDIVKMDAFISAVYPEQYAKFIQELAKLDTPPAQEEAA